MHSRGPDRTESWPGHRTSREERTPQANGAAVVKVAATTASGSERDASGAAASGFEPAGGEAFTLRADEAFMDLHGPPPPYMHAAGSLDLTTPLEECGSIRVALLPVGAIDAATFRRYAALCAAHASQLQLAEVSRGQV